jgi:hypothetical protein
VSAVQNRSSIISPLAVMFPNGFNIKLLKASKLQTRPNLTPSPATARKYANSYHLYFFFDGDGLA